MAASDIAAAAPINRGADESDGLFLGVGVSLGSFGGFSARCAYVPQLLPLTRPALSELAGRAGPTPHGFTIAG